MALMNSQIGTLSYEEITFNRYITNTDYNCGGLPDELNTFTYVVNNLRTWADDTTIGAELIAELEKINNAIQKLLDSSILLDNEIKEFIERQKAINNGNV